MALTITIPGAVEATIGATAPAVLTVGVGTPGATGPAGAAGPGVAVGGTTGQVLQKLSATNYDTGWLTLPADYITSVTAPLAVASGVLSVNLSAYSTTAQAAALYYPLSGNPSAFLVAADITGKANLASPSLTGTPLAPTASTGTSSTQIATTAFVQDAVIAGSAHAETLQATVRNNTGATLSPFTVVYINGALGNNATVAKAQANSEATSSGTFAVTQAAISNNADGIVISAGVLSNIDTSAYTDGDKLYLSPTTAGAVTTTKPSAPNHLVYVGVVTRSHPTQGTVSVRIQNGYELDELHDVAITSKTDLDLLTYESSTSLWKNKSFSTLGLAQLAGATFTGLIGTVASTTTTAGLNVPHGAAPTSPVNGDIWTTTSGVFARINAGTTQLMNLSSSQTASGNITFSNANQTLGNSTATGTVNVASGATISASTKTVNVATGGVSGSTTTTTIGPVLGASTTSIGNTTAASTLNLATGATLTATTKAVNIGTSGVAGSTTNIAIGSTTGTSTTTLQGTTNGITQTAGDSTTALATTAFVTTADNLKANLASPTFTGTPTLPTGTIATTQTAGNNTTAVATTAFVTAAVPAIATNAQAIIGTSSTTAIAPSIIGAVISHPELRPLNYFTQTAVSGSGAVTSGSVAYGQREMYTSASLSAGRAAWSYGIVGSNANNMSRADWRKLDFSKKIWMSGKAMVYSTTGFGTSYPGDANTFARITLGGYNGNATGDMTIKGIGWKKQGGSAPFFALTVHNGTSLTDVATTIAPIDNQSIDWLIYSDGTGNVTLYIDGVQAATTTAGPTGTTANYANSYREQVEAAITATARTIMECTGGFLYIEG